MNRKIDSCTSCKPMQPCCNRRSTGEPARVKALSFHLIMWLACVPVQRKLQGCRASFRNGRLRPTKKGVGCLAQGKGSRAEGAVRVVSATGETECAAGAGGGQGNRAAQGCGEGFGAEGSSSRA